MFGAQYYMGHRSGFCYLYIVILEDSYLDIYIYNLSFIMIEKYLINVNIGDV